MFENIQNLIGMRSAEYDKKQVFCPNASTLGGNPYKARIGDFILYKTGFTNGNSQLTLGRMIGRVRYAPAMAAENPDNAAPAIKGYILTLELSDNGSSAYIRWIAPGDVIQIERPSKGKASFAEFFFSEKLPFRTNELCRLSYHGTLCDRYYTLEHATEVIKTQNDRLRAAGIAVPKG